ncbi:MAG: hypothetical protein WBP72_04260, partial [Rhodocyclaceae bacterium]
LSPFLYVQLIWATLLGYAVFGQMPDGVAALGMAVIAASGLAIALGERRKSGGRERGPEGGSPR